MEQKTEKIVGNRYILDKGFVNSGEVIVVKVHGKHFCKIKDPESGSVWDTRISRLSEIEYNSQKQES